MPNPHTAQYRHRDTFGTEPSYNQGGAGGLMSGPGATSYPMPSAPAPNYGPGAASGAAQAPGKTLLEWALPFGDVMHQRRQAKWAQQQQMLAQQIAVQAQAQMQGIMRGPQNLGASQPNPMGNGLVGMTAPFNPAQMTPRQQQAQESAIRSDLWGQMGRPLMAQEERERAYSLSQESYQYQREQGRQDRTEERQKRKSDLEIENMIRGNPQKELAPSTMAATQVRMAQEHVERAGGVENMTAADDEMLLTRFAKSLRPREALMSDDAARMAANSTVGTFAHYVQQLTENNKLSVTQRRDILRSMRNIGAGAYKEYQRIRADQTDQAQRFEVQQRPGIPAPSGVGQLEPENASRYEYHDD